MSLAECKAATAFYVPYSIQPSHPALLVGQSRQAASFWWDCEHARELHGGSSARPRILYLARAIGGIHPCKMHSEVHCHSSIPVTRDMRSWTIRSDAKCTVVVFLMLGMSLICNLRCNWWPQHPFSFSLIFLSSMECYGITIR